jgi:glycosyltransferase involved in cell wall biosynthesis
VRIAQVAPLYERVPPRLYGGTERVVSYLTEELVSMGHEVTLFASGDSVTSGTLVAGCPQALRLSERMRFEIPRHLTMLDEVRRRAAEFDVVHFHTDTLHFPLARHLGVPHLTTVHGRLDLPELVSFYECVADLPLVSISDAQRQPLRQGRWAGTVHHGLRAGALGPSTRRGQYLAFLGRISPEKGVEQAIEIARRAGMPLVIAAKLEELDRRYYECIAEQMRQAHVHFVGEVNEDDKQQLLGDAEALLFPIAWPEPFGLVMIESLWCGTPVIAFRCGSVPEVIDDGVTGFICDDVPGAVRAVDRVRELDRAACAAVARRRFSAARMAADYVQLYEAACAGFSATSAA